MAGRFHTILVGGAAVALLIASAACGGTVQPGGPPSPVADPAPSSSTAPTTSAPPRVNFDAAIRQAVRDVPDGTISLAIFDRDSDTMVGSYRPDTPWYTESVVKLLIGLDSLDNGGSAAQVAEMISRSDDTTASTLWAKLGGTRIVTTMAARIGLTSTTPPSKPGEWGDTRVTADDLVLIYRYLLDRAPSGERATIVTAMHDATRLGADGTDQYFGIPYAVGGSTYWAVKQGWACCEPGWVLNTTGIVGAGQRSIVVALTSHDTGAGAAVRERDGNELTQAVKDLLPDLTA